MWRWDKRTGKKEFPKGGDMGRKKRILMIAVIVFIALFTARFVYEYARSDANGTGYGNVAMLSAESGYERKNYASAKVAVNQTPSGAQVVEQKYERVSTIESKTQHWDSDIAALKLAIEGAQALVQKENAYGLDGERVLSLSLGVIPDAFDPTVDTLKSIGNLVSANVTKTDRTSDFRSFEARRLSLEKTREVLVGLRSDGAQLADRIALETHILEIEGQIQELGVNLGDYSELNSFCTIHFTLREIPTQRVCARILAAALTALGWTVLVYLGIAASALAVLGIAALAVRLIERLNTGKGPE